jgi:hypothetical protein
MPRTPASNQAQYKYNREHLKRIPLDVRKDHYEQIAAAAAAAGEPVNTYIKKAIDMRMKAERKPTGKMLPLTYYVTFGKGDSSDIFDWEVELTDEEYEKAERAALRGRIDWMDDALKDALDRAEAEILEKVKAELEEAGDEWSDGYDLVVHYDAEFFGE